MEQPLTVRSLWLFCMTLQPLHGAAARYSLAQAFLADARKPSDISSAADCPWTPLPRSALHCGDAQKYYAVRRHSDGVGIVHDAKIFLLPDVAHLYGAVEAKLPEVDGCR